MADHGELALSLEQIVGSENVQADEDVAREYAVAGKNPSLVVAPGSHEEVAAVVEAIGQSGAAVIPWGGGTMMGRGHVPTAYSVALRLSRVCEILDFDEANLTVTAQAGLTLDSLQAHLGKSRQFLPLNPSSPEKATVGGTVAANASGPGRFSYGSARDLVLGMGVVLANGETVRAGGKTVKNVAGYDLCKLFVGSYGALGIVTDVTFRLLPIPEQQKVLRLAFDGIGCALDLTGRILDSELLPTSLDVLTGPAIEWTLGEPREPCVLVIAVDGSEETVERQLKQISSMADSAAARSVSVVDGAERKELMETVRDFVPSALSDSRETAFTANVPLSSVGSFVVEVENEAARLGLGVGCLVAAGAGTARCVVDGTASPELTALFDRAATTAGQLGGHCVLDRAAPDVQQRVPVWGQPRADWRIAGVLKQRFDPAGLFNRGRFVDHT